MNDQAPHARSAPAEAAAMTCLAHLEQEEAMLSGTLQLLREVRATLLRRDLEGLARALERQQHTAKAAAELTALRAQLRGQWGRALGMPASEVTIAAIAERVAGQLGDRLLRCRARLAEMAREIDLLNRGNVGLIRQSMELLEQLIMVLTGAQPASDRYGARGQMEQDNCGSIFQARY